MAVLIAGILGLGAGLLAFVYLEGKQRQSMRARLRKHITLTAADTAAGIAAGTTPGSAPGTMPGMVHGHSIFQALSALLARLPFVGARQEKQRRARLLRHTESELPRMLGILAMGMEAGLGFDAALALYVHRFDTVLARMCLERFELWERGLISRSEGLEQLAKSLDLPLFDRFCRTAARGVRYGIPLAPLVREYAHEARREFQNKQKEVVLKAPVKMLIPTGAFLLPAMLLLVIGPLILDVTERMV